MNLIRNAQIIPKSQEKAMVDQLIVVDKQDKPLGAVTKQLGIPSLITRIAHNTKYIKSHAKTPHRSFSVLLFNSKNELLLQRRSRQKVTFPLFWANTCCSHPRHNQREMGIENDIGIKRAAVKRLEVEMGINAVHEKDFTVAGKFMYQALFDSEWEEHELNYLLIAKKDVAHKINSDEVEETCYVPKDNFHHFISERKKKGERISPWFNLIIENRLDDIWAAVVRNDVASLKNSSIANYL